MPLLQQDPKLVPAHGAFEISLQAHPSVLDFA
jgi:hypothetical protein